MFDQRAVCYQMAFCCFNMYLHIELFGRFLCFKNSKELHTDGLGRLACCLKIDEYPCKLVRERNIV